MSTRAFIDGPFCRRGSSGAEPRNCERCRDQSASGEAFRAGLVRGGLTLPVVADGEPAHRFPCPVERGAKPWGWRAPSRGLGDTVSKVIKAVTLGTVKECGGCARRRAALNKLLPYSSSGET
jgi:hypothetical protein